MKITGGEFKGKQIKCPPGKDIRPTLSKVRQGIFNVLYSLSFDIHEAHVLELFAGTGIISFESISRGASHAVLVDSSSKSLKFIEKNASSLGIGEKVKIVKQDAIDFTRCSEISLFDLIFFDPPYRYELHAQLLKNLAPRISDKTIIVVESNRIIIDEDNDLNLNVLKTKKWGDNFVSFIKKA